MQLSSVKEILLLIFLSKSLRMQKNAEDIRQSMVEKMDNERQLSGVGESRYHEQTHTYLLQSKRPVSSHYRCNGHVHNYGQVIKW